MLSIVHTVGTCQRHVLVNVHKEDLPLANPYESCVFGFAVGKPYESRVSGFAVVKSLRLDATRNKTKAMNAKKATPNKK